MFQKTIKLLILLVISSQQNLFASSKAKEPEPKDSNDFVLQVDLTEFMDLMNVAAYSDRDEINFINPEESEEKIIATLRNSLAQEDELGFIDGAQVLCQCSCFIRLQSKNYKKSGGKISPSLKRKELKRQARAAIRRKKESRSSKKMLKSRIAVASSESSFAQFVEDLGARENLVSRLELDGRARNLKELFQYLGSNIFEQDSKSPWNVSCERATGFSKTCQTIKSPSFLLENKFIAQYFFCCPYQDSESSELHQATVF